jgi:hypothetical protein
MVQTGISNGLAMRIIIWAVALLLLAGCSGGMTAIAVDQSETISMAYEDGFGTRDVEATSSKGEVFQGVLIWIKEPGTVGRYRGALVGNKGRTLQVEMECNTFTAKCAGTARDSAGVGYFIR